MFMCMCGDLSVSAHVCRCICICACIRVFVCVCESPDHSLRVLGSHFAIVSYSSKGAGADLPIPSNEAMANQWKHLGTLKCVPAMYRVQPISSARV